MRDRLTEIAWDHHGDYCGTHDLRGAFAEKRVASLARTRRIKRKRLSPARAHVCLSAKTVEKLGLRRSDLTLPWDANGATGCGVFICSRCRRATPWCLGASESLLCDFCYRPEE